MASLKTKFQSLSQFDDRGFLGRGGFGVVRNMFHLESGRSYAIKTVNLTKLMLSCDEEHSAKLRKSVFEEAEILYRLNHANIVKVFGSFTDKADAADMLYIVMELCQKTFKKLIEETEGEVKERVVLGWMVQLLSALKFLHEVEHILHRDIKSENILVAEDGTTLKIGDFGISKLASSMSALSAKTGLGTYTHMAPEVALGEPHTWKSDTWSLGVVFFEACTKRVPFPLIGNGIPTMLAITGGDIPTLPERFSRELKILFSEKILVRDLNKRAMISELYDHRVFKKYVSNLEQHAELDNLRRELASCKLKITKLSDENKRLKRLLQSGAKLGVQPAAIENKNKSDMVTMEVKGIQPRFEAFPEGPNDPQGFANIANNVVLIFHNNCEIQVVKNFATDKCHVSLITAIGSEFGFVAQVCYVEKHDVVILLMRKVIDEVWLFSLCILENASSIPLNKLQPKLKLLRKLTGKYNWGICYEAAQDLLFVVKQQGVFCFRFHKASCSCELLHTLEMSHRPSYCAAIAQSENTVILATSSYRTQTVQFHRIILSDNKVDALLLDGKTITDLIKPEGLVFDSTGKRFFVIENGTSCIHVYDASNLGESSKLRKIWTSPPYEKNDMTFIGLATENKLMQEVAFVAASHDHWIAKINIPELC